MPDADAITRKLDFMRADIEEPGSSPAARLVAGHAALLLAAAESALKLADDWEQVPALRGYECAAALRRAITAALAKEANDDR
jgi:hypothetical protein